MRRALLPHSLRSHTAGSSRRAGDQRTARIVASTLVAVVWTATGTGVAHAQLDGPQVQWLAQSNQGSPPLTLPIEPTPAGPMGTSVPPGYLFSIANTPAQSLGWSLAQHGIYLEGVAAGAVETIPGGGIKNGTVYDNFEFSGADFDMSKILNVPGGQVHVSFNYLSGANESQYSGSGIDAPWVYCKVENFYLQELSWDQSLANDQIRFLIGRISVDYDFDTSEIYSHFVAMNINRNPAAMYADQGSAVIPFTEWGGRITLKPTVDTYFRTGAYESGDTSYLYGTAASYHGFNFGTNQATGVLIPVEAGYKSNFDTDAYPRPQDSPHF